MNIVLLSAKYLIVLFFLLFVFSSFRAQRDAPDDIKRRNYSHQKAFLFLVHALSYLCIILHAYTDDLSFTYKEALIFYAGQLLYLIIMTSVIPACTALNKGMNNIMCMFIVICMVIQSRLNFAACVRQFWMLLISSAVFLVFVFFCKRSHFLHKLKWLYCIAGLGLLSAVLVLSTVTNGAKLSLDFHGFSFQPMEFVKIIFVLFVAAAFNKTRNFKTVVVTAVFAALHVIILVFCRDLGSALILFAIYVFMLYVATKKARYLIAGAGGLVAASLVAYKLFSHVRVRISVWRDPWSDINDKGYQITQALFAIGTGGWLGAGLFGGSPGYVPEISNDMVFSAISEELGGIFAILLIFLCLCFELMIMRVAIRLEYRFYKLLAFGIGIAYIFQAFLNIGGTMNFIPLTGVNLPFISSGGSSLLSSMIMAGIVQALYVISEHDAEKERIAVANGEDLKHYFRINDDEEPAFSQYPVDEQDHKFDYLFTDEKMYEDDRLVSRDKKKTRKNNKKINKDINQSYEKIYIERNGNNATENYHLSEDSERKLRTEKRYYNASLNDPDEYEKYEKYYENTIRNRMSSIENDRTNPEKTKVIIRKKRKSIRHVNTEDIE